MSVLGRALLFFPAIILMSALASIGLAVSRGAPLWLFVAAACLYLVPLICFRVHSFFFPKREGLTRISGPGYSPWWGGHQIQLIYIGFPFLEAPLRMIPGAFSLWLRLWGSRIGEGVYWTPEVSIVDRDLLEVGDGVVFGHRVVTLSHVIRPGKRGMLLFVKRVRIGSGAFIGAGSAIGPGSEIQAGALLPVESRVFVNESVGGDNPGDSSGDRQ